jgi:hypothetical protein
VPSWLITQRSQVQILPPLPGSAGQRPDRQDGGQAFWLLFRSSSVGFGPGARHAPGRVGVDWHRGRLSVPIFGTLLVRLGLGVATGDALRVAHRGGGPQEEGLARRGRPSQVASAALPPHGPTHPGQSPWWPPDARPPATQGDRFGGALNARAGTGRRFAFAIPVTVSYGARARRRITWDTPDRTVVPGGVASGCQTSHRLMCLCR